MDPLLREASWIGWGHKHERAASIPLRRVCGVCNDRRRHCLSGSMTNEHRQLIMSVCADCFNATPVHTLSALLNLVGVPAGTSLYPHVVINKRRAL